MKPKTLGHSIRDREKAVKKQAALNNDVAIKKRDEFNKKMKDDKFRLEFEIDKIKSAISCLNYDIGRGVYLPSATSGKMAAYQKQLKEKEEELKKLQNE